MRESLKKKRARVEILVTSLHELYPDATTALDHEDAFELLVATVLSAQCTDERVNKVTPELFRAYPSAAELAEADREELEQAIHSTGFYRNKAKSLLGLAKALVERHDGAVPGTMEELVKVPGVGRKTANVVLGNCFDVPSIAVDTHVKRLSGRLALTKNTDPVKIERDLMKITSEEEWTFLSHGLILHGRQVCKARRPSCEDCGLRSDCPFPKSM